MKHPFRINFLNTYIDSVTSEEAIGEVDRLIHQGEPSYVVTPNSDIIVQMQKDVELKQICDNASLILTDGMVLVRLAEKLGTPIKERVCMTDFVWDVGRLAEQHGYKVFMFGGREEVLKKAASNFTSKLENLNLCGLYSPPLGFEKDKDEYDAALSVIRKAEPDILLVFLGCPKQEKFIHGALGKLNVPISIPMGGCVDFLAEEVKRAPLWMQNHSLEWLYRFAQDPRRLFRRYFIDDIAIFSLARKYKKK